MVSNQQTNWLDRCLLILGQMNAPRGQEWTDGLIEFYSIFLSRMDRECITTAVEWAAQNRTWRPTIDQLREIAADLSSPAPSAGDAWHEIWYYVQHHCPERWSHSVVERIVYRLGGYPFLQSVYNPQTASPFLLDSLRKQFETAYSAAASEWRRDVSQQLSLPACRRDPKYFPPARPLALSAPPSEQYMLRAEIEAERSSVPLDEIYKRMPDHIRKKILQLKEERRMPGLSRSLHKSQKDASAPEAFSGRKRESKCK